MTNEVKPDESAIFRSRPVVRSITRVWRSSRYASVIFDAGSLMVIFLPDIRRSPGCSLLMSMPALTTPWASNKTRLSPSTAIHFTSSRITTFSMMYLTVTSSETVCTCCRTEAVL